MELPSFSPCLNSIVFLAAILALLCSRVDTNSENCEASELGYACKKQLAPFYAVHWTLGGSPARADLLNGEVPFPDEGEAAFALAGSTTGWVGFGFTGRSGMMFPADVVLGFVKEDGESSVRAFKVENYGIREDNADESVNLKNVFVSEVDGKTIVAYTRSVREGGSIPVSLDAETPVTFAVGPFDGLNYHRRSRGGGSILLAAALSDTTDIEVSTPSSEG
ncbi:hypothetical protein BSKO_07737 [Bryopsis sp. KO-2023]|nr:hypothetical protein BSKO_07737 [Bryopsis sp. KO-2023]